MAKNHKNKAFSMIELSITITIIALIAAASLSTVISDSNIKKLRITNERTKAIYKAMGIYLSKNSKLPCPAPITTVTKSNASYGVQASSCSTTPSSGSGYWQSSNSTNSPNLYYGMVPTSTLELPANFAEDGFGSRFGYAILSGFTDADNFPLDSSDVSSSQNYANNSSAVNRIVIKRAVGNTLETLESDAIFVIISYGANKSGSWNPESTIQNTITTDTTYETENDVSSIDTPDGGKASFDNIFISTTINNSIFDDILFYKTRDQMINDFNLYHLLPCKATTIDGNAYPQAYYKEIKASTTQCTPGNRGSVWSPTIKCGILGNWESQIINNCTAG